MKPTLTILSLLTMSLTVFADNVVYPQYIALGTRVPITEVPATVEISAKISQKVQLPFTDTRMVLLAGNEALYTFSIEGQNSYSVNFIHSMTNQFNERVKTMKANCGDKSISITGQIAEMDSSVMNSNTKTRVIDPRTIEMVCK